MILFDTNGRRKRIFCVEITQNETGEINFRRPNIETYGSTFDTILEECFEISPPISDIPKREIEQLMQSDDVEKIKKAMKGLGDSVERMYLADRIRMLKAKETE